MSLILQGMAELSCSRGLSFQSVSESRNHPSFIECINSLQCTVNPRILSTFNDNQKIQDERTTPFLSSSRVENPTRRVAKKADEWNKEYYGTVNYYISSVTESPSFSSGLACNMRKVNAFQQSTREGYLSAFRYIANNTNQNYYLGILRNIFSFFSTGALNQNCVFCSKAVDKNLAELATGNVNAFWVANQTRRGSLPQNVKEKSYKNFVMQPGRSLSSQLLISTRAGSRNIIMVPVKNKNFSHAMNLVRTKTGDIVIDGQSGRVYDFSSVEGRQRFDERYGRNRTFNVVQIYHTGQAPVLGSLLLG